MKLQAESLFFSTVLFLSERSGGGKFWKHHSEIFHLNQCELWVSPAGGTVTCIVALSQWKAPKVTLTHGPLLLQRRAILRASSWPNLLLQLEEQAWARGLEAAEASALTQGRWPSIWLRSACTGPGKVCSCHEMNRMICGLIASGQVLPPSKFSLSRMCHQIN